jgi:ABC-type sugar transport system substrate-binding protein
LQETDAVAVARRLKIPLETRFADNSVDTQIEQIGTFLQSCSSSSMAVIEAVDDESLADLAHTAVRAGIGWLLLQRVAQYLRPLRSAFPTATISTISADHEEIGRLQGKQALALLRGRGTVLYVRGPQTASSAADRLRGFLEVASGAAITHHVVSADWTEAGSEKLVSNWFMSSENAGGVQLISCQNDAMAMGAIRGAARAAAIARHPEWTSLPVTGVDGNPDFGKLMVDQQRLAATVLMPSAAGRAIELINDLWTVPRFSPPVIVRLAVQSYPDLAQVIGTDSRSARPSKV